MVAALAAAAAVLVVLSRRSGEGEEAGGRAGSEPPEWEVDEWGRESFPASDPPQNW